MYDNFRNNPAYDFLPRNKFHKLFKKRKTGRKLADGTPILRAVLGTAFIAWILLCIHLWFRLP